MTVKEVVEQVGRELNADATIEDAMDKIMLRYEIELGREELRNGLGIPHEEAKKRLSKWLT